MIGAELNTVKSRKQRISSSNTKFNLPIKGRLANPSYAKSYVAPTFTLKQIRDKVPIHCFERDTVRSLSHVVKDLTMMLILGYLATNIDILPDTLQPVAWLLYWVCQGIVCTGVWVLAHECGHGAFSSHSWVNNLVGYILHSFLLVPYFSWKFTHSKHHKGTNHMEKDQVFVPSTRSAIESKNNQSYPKIDPLHHSNESVFDESPLMNFFLLLRMLLVGWPLYLLFNVTSQNHPEWVSHFFPNSPIFDDRERRQVILSNIGMIVMLGILTYTSIAFGFSTVLCYYLIPYLNVNFWLVLITFLQHTDPIVPKYRNQEWDFMKGALATVDRDFGILNYFFHHITDTHVAHHLFSTMPFYHAKEATLAIKPFLKNYYLYDDTHWFFAAMKANKLCKFVEDDGDIVWFKY